MGYGGGANGSKEHGGVDYFIYLTAESRKVEQRHIGVKNFVVKHIERSPYEKNQHAKNCRSQNYARADGFFAENGIKRHKNRTCGDGVIAYIADGAYKHIVVYGKGRCLAAAI